MGIFRPRQARNLHPAPALPYEARSLVGLRFAEHQESHDAQDERGADHDSAISETASRPRRLPNTPLTKAPKSGSATITKSSVKFSAETRQLRSACSSSQCRMRPRRRCRRSGGAVVDDDNPRPTATSAAATAMMKKANIWPTIESECTRL